jgi:uncharacterized protein (DUF934 family)
MTDSNSDEIILDGNQETATNSLEVFMSYDNEEEAVEFLKGFLRDLSDTDFLQLIANDLPRQNDERSMKFGELVRSEIVYRNPEF